MNKSLIELQPCHIKSFYKINSNLGLNLHSTTLHQDCPQVQAENHPVKQEAPFRSGMHNIRPVGQMWSAELCDLAAKI